MKINWIGCKKKMLPTLINHLPTNYNRYFEPFVGSGVLYLEILPNKALLSDNDSNLITMWHTILSIPELFWQGVLDYEEKLFSDDNQQIQKAQYKELLIQFNNHEIRNDLCKSCVLYVLLKYAFCGVFKYKKNGDLSCYFGYKPKQKTPIIELEILQDLSERNQHEQLFIEHADYKEIIQLAQKDDFLFIDPPYYYENVKSKDFYQSEFTFEDHQNLAQELKDAHSRGAKFLYTNFATNKILDLFKEFNIHKINLTTSHATTNKTVKQEVIIKNY